MWTGPCRTREILANIDNTIFSDLAGGAKYSLKEKFPSMYPFIEKMIYEERSLMLLERFSYFGGEMPVVGLM